MLKMQNPDMTAVTKQAMMAREALARVLGSVEVTHST